MKQCSTRQWLYLHRKFHLMSTKSFFHYLDKRSFKDSTRVAGRKRKKGFFFSQNVFCRRGDIFILVHVEAMKIEDHGNERTEVSQKKKGRRRLKVSTPPGLIKCRWEKGAKKTWSWCLSAIETASNWQKWLFDSEENSDEKFHSFKREKFSD